MSIERGIGGDKFDTESPLGQSVGDACHDGMIVLDAAR
jgi:hypothetical protein